MKRLLFLVIASLVICSSNIYASMNEVIETVVKEHDQEGCSGQQEQEGCSGQQEQEGQQDSGDKNLSQEQGS